MHMSTNCSFQESREHSQQGWARALVQWLWYETRNLKVAGSCSRVGREPWSSGYGIILAILRSWVCASFANAHVYKFNFEEFREHSQEVWVGALAQWLWNETCNLKVVGSNPSTVNIFHIELLKISINVGLKKTEIKRKRGWDGPLKICFY